MERDSKATQVTSSHSPQPQRLERLLFCLLSGRLGSLLRKPAVLPLRPCFTALQQTLR